MLQYLFSWFNYEKSEIQLNIFSLGFSHISYIEGTYRVRIFSIPFLSIICFYSIDRH